MKVLLETPEGTIEGQTANISISGLALILFLEKPIAGDTFPITLLLPDTQEMIVTCKKVWSGDVVAYETVFNAIGVKFTELSPNNQMILKALIKENYLTSLIKAS